MDEIRTFDDMIAWLENHFKAIIDWLKALIFKPVEKDDDTTID